MRAALCHPEHKHYSRDLCKNCYMTKFRKENPEYRERMRIYLKAYCLKHRDKDSLRKKKDRLDPEKRPRILLRHREAQLKRRFGITFAQMDAMFIAQDHQCGICHIPISRQRRQAVAVDHDHSTGKIRGLLCLNCNSGIGMLGDTEQAVEAALVYLRAAKSKAIETMVADNSTKEEAK